LLLTAPKDKPKSPPLDRPGDGAAAAVLRDWRAVVTQQPPALLPSDHRRSVVVSWFHGRMA